MRSCLAIVRSFFRLVFLCRSITAYCRATRARAAVAAVAGLRCHPCRRRGAARSVRASVHDVGLCHVRRTPSPPRTPLRVSLPATVSTASCKARAEAPNGRPRWLPAPSATMAEHAERLQPVLVLALAWFSGRTVWGALRGDAGARCSPPHASRTAPSQRTASPRAGDDLKSTACLVM